MGYPDAFRNAVLGFGALALVTLPSGSVAQEGPPDPNMNRPAAVATAFVNNTTDRAEASAFDRSAADNRPTLVSANADTVEVEMPKVQPANEERPYAYVRFDGQTAEDFPNAIPLNAMIENPDKLIVINFIDEKNRFSAMQSQVLQQTLTALAPRSEAKELMLMDVVIRDAEGNNFYWPFYASYYDENRLGPDGGKREDAILPYGVVWGDPLREGSDDFTLFDFALMNGVQNDADLNANAEGIAGSMYNVILNYNQKKVAALDNNKGPVIAGLQ